MILPREPGAHESDGGPPVLIGLTGPIGCGKSTVAHMLADVGGAVIDADELAREATQAGSPALPEIRARFGDGVFGADGGLDRAALASVVFADAAALADLERVVHPRVRDLVEERLERATRDGVPFAVVEAIKLVEGGLAKRCDEVWIVDCEPHTQRARLAGRGAQPEDIERRMAAQGGDLTARLSARLSGGRLRVLVTDGSLDATRDKVEDALADLLDQPTER